MKPILVTEERMTVGGKTLMQYLKEINSYPPLTPDEEYKLSIRMVEGDDRAKEKLIKHNLRFVVSVAKKYYGNNGTLEDLINEGNYGLIMASNNFDPSRGFKFISYAVWWVRRNILMFLSNKDCMIRLPHHKTHLISKIKESYMALEQRLEKQPTVNDMIQYFGNEYLVEDIELFYNHYLLNIKQLDNEMEEGEGTTHIDFMTNDLFPSTDHLTDNDDSTYRIDKLMSILNKKQAQVLVRFFGLDGDEPDSLDTIGIKMGLTKERVRQIKEKSLDILRNKKDLKYIYN